MNDQKKTKKQLIGEIEALREKLCQLEGTSGNMTGKNRGSAILESEETFRSVVNHASIGIVIIRDGEQAFSNSRMANMLGYTEREFGEREFSLHIHPDDRALALERVGKRISGDYKGRDPVELRLLTKSGDTIWVEAISSVIQWEGNRAVQAFVTDITERRRAEALLRAERDLGAELNAVTRLEDGARLCLEAALRVSDLDCGGVYLRDNESGALELVYHTGLSQSFVDRASRFEEGSTNTRLVMAGKPVYSSHDQLDVQKDGGRQRENLRAIAVIPIHYKHDVIGCLNVASHTLDEVPAYSRDTLETITTQMGSVFARLQIEEALRVSEKNFRNLAEHSPNMIFINKKGRVVFANDRCEEIMGYSREEFLSADFNFLSVIAPESVAVIKSSFTQHMNGKDVEPYEYALLRKDGKKLNAIINTKLVEFQGGTSILGIVTDISDRKQAEEALRESEERYRSLYDAVQAGVILQDADGTILHTNRVACERFGMTQEDIISKTPMDPIWSMVAEDGTLVTEEEHPLTITTRTGKPVRNAVRGLFADDQQRMRWLLINTEPVVDGETHDLKHVLVTFADITDQRKMEEELAKADKLESVGVLAGGIAHDFNNLLTGIFGNISLAKMDVEEDTETHQLLSEAEEAAVRARDLTHQLLTFSKGGAPIKETALVSEIIRDSASFALRGSNVRCDLRIQENLSNVEADVGQISQVVSNLVMNADQAMPEGGSITITADNESVGVRDSVPLHAGDYVKITVQDTGIGIPDDHIGKIFDPFFTTKQKGNGLGLATAYSIVKRHDGFIDVESRLGVGTTFRIYLPASENPIEFPEDISDESLTGSERILVMDDDELVRKTAGLALSRLGYDVSFATDGQEAVKMYQNDMKSEKPFDAVILDLTVAGGMGGKDAIRKLREIDPDVKAIVSTGYSTDIAVSNYAEYGFRATANKPYRVKDIGRVVRQVLADKSAGN